MYRFKFHKQPSLETPHVHIVSACFSFPLWPFCPSVLFLALTANYFQAMSLSFRPILPCMQSFCYSSAVLYCFYGIGTVPYVMCITCTVLVCATALLKHFQSKFVRYVVRCPVWKVRNDDFCKDSMWTLLIASLCSFRTLVSMV